MIKIKFFPSGHLSRYFSFLLLGLIAGQLQAQSLRYPLHTSPLLSGNFGELRSTHLHTGIDFKTGGVEGLPVICVQDAVLVRVVVSPTGYGRALYLEHAGGITTVYAHLSRFAPSVEAAVREIQYQTESFSVDADFLYHEILFHAGDTIGYSGNTGSSGGPHLHFEVRKSDTEQPLNPQFFLNIPDDIPPLVRGLFLYEVTPDNEVVAERSVPLKRGAAGEYAGGTVFVPAGRVGVALQAEDRMTGSNNRLGVYDLQIRQGECLFYHLRMDTLVFGRGPLVHEVRDYHHSRAGRLVYTGFGFYGDQVFPQRSRGNGLIYVQPDSLYPVEVLLTDYAGNRSVVRFVIRGGLPVERRPEAGSRLLPSQPGGEIRLGEYTLTWEAGSLPAAVRVAPCLDTLSRVLRLTEKEVPLYRRARLKVQGDFSARSVICQVGADGRLSPLATRQTEDGIEAPVAFLANFTVAPDTVAPEVKYQGVSGGKLRFRISDDFSGITRYRVEVNGKWCLPEYDPKRLSLTVALKETPFHRGENTVRVTVEDGVGNLTTFEGTVKK